MIERNVISKSWVVHVTITRSDKVLYRESGSGRLHAEGTVPLEEEVPEIDVKINQESIAGAVGSAISILTIRSPRTEGEIDDFLGEGKG